MKDQHLTQYPLRMDKKNHAKVKQQAKEQDRSMNWVINDAIEKYKKENQ